MISQEIKAYRLSSEEIYYADRMLKFYFSKSKKEHRLPEIYIGNFLEFKKEGMVEEEIPITISEKFPRKLKYDQSETELVNPDFLGFYRYGNNKEGRVFLYKDRLEKCAKRFSHQLELDFLETYEILCFKVLFHELGHWATHWVCKLNTHFGYDLFLELSKDTKESMAQLNVLWTLQPHRNKRVRLIRKVFFHLVDRQPEEYQIFQRLDEQKAHLRNEKSFTKRKTILNRYIKILNHEKGFSGDFYYLLHGKELDLTI